MIMIVYILITYIHIYIYMLWLYNILYVLYYNVYYIYMCVIDSGCVIDSDYICTLWNERSIMIIYVQYCTIVYLQWMMNPKWIAKLLDMIWPTTALGISSSPWPSSAQDPFHLPIREKKKVTADTISIGLEVCNILKWWLMIIC